jgi:DNA-binding NarL/FixJ family response regulator
MTIRLVLADDQELVRAGFRMILESHDDLEVVGEAADGVEAVDLARELRPDLVLMDIRMPRQDGVTATGIIATDCPEVRVLVLTTFDLDEYVYDALEAGASGFLLKDVGRDELVTAVRIVARGDALIAPAITRRLLADFVRRRPAPSAAGTTGDSDDLTAREWDTMRLLARGKSNAEIAAALVVSEHTVKTHVGNIFMKLGLRDRIHAIIYAYDHGIVTPTDQS